MSILVFGGVLIESEDNSMIVDLKNVWVQYNSPVELYSGCS